MARGLNRQMLNSICTCGSHATYNCYTYGMWLTPHAATSGFPTTHWTDRPQRVYSAQGPNQKQHFRVHSHPSLGPPFAVIIAINNSFRAYISEVSLNKFNEPTDQPTDRQSNALLVARHAGSGWIHLPCMTVTPLHAMAVFFFSFFYSVSLKWTCRAEEGAFGTDIIHMRLARVIGATECTGSGAWGEQTRCTALTCFQSGPGTLIAFLGNTYIFLKACVASDPAEPAAWNHL